MFVRVVVMCAGLQCPTSQKYASPGWERTTAWSRRNLRYSCREPASPLVIMSQHTTTTTWHDTTHSKFTRTDQPNVDARLDSASGASPTCHRTCNLYGTRHRLMLHTLAAGDPAMSAWFEPWWTSLQNRRLTSWRRCPARTLSTTPLWSDPWSAGWSAGRPCGYDHASG